MLHIYGQVIKVSWKSLLLPANPLWYISNGHDNSRKFLQSNDVSFSITISLSKECQGDIGQYWKFAFWLNLIYHNKGDYFLTNAERTIQKFNQKEKKSSIFVKHAQTGNEDN